MLRLPYLCLASSGVAGFDHSSHAGRDCPRIGATRPDYSKLRRVSQKRSAWADGSDHDGHGHGDTINDDYQNGLGLKDHANNSPLHRLVSVIGRKFADNNRHCTSRQSHCFSTQRLITVGVIVPNSSAFPLPPGTTARAGIITAFDASMTDSVIQSQALATSSDDSRPPSPMAITKFTTTVLRSISQGFPSTRHFSGPATRRHAWRLSIDLRRGHLLCSIVPLEVVKLGAQYRGVWSLSILGKPGLGQNFFHAIGRILRLPLCVY